MPILKMPLKTATHLDHMDKADVIVVLGAAVWTGGRPSPALRRRVLHAVELLRCGRSDVLMVSGGIGKNPPSEARVMKQVALLHGVAGDKIIMEEKARSTLESAAACSRIIRKNEWSTALIVSDRYHLMRSAFLFRRFGVRVVCSSPEDREFKIGRWKWWYLHIREIIALVWSIFRILVQKTK